MNDEIKNGKIELSLDTLEQITGGGLLQDLCNKIINSGNASRYKNILKTEGKAVAVATCCGDFPELCGFCSTAISML